MFSQLRPPTVRAAAVTASAQVSRDLWITRLYYLLFYSAVATITPFLNVYLEKNGLSGAQIGWISSIPPLVSLLAGPFWSAIADRWQIHRAVLGLLTLLAGLTSLLFLTSVQFWPVLCFIVAMTFFRNPVAPLIDSTAVRLVKQSGSTYGRQRLWGSIGFASVSYIMGRLLTTDDLTLAFWSHAIILIVGCTGLSWLLPVQSRGQPQVNLWVGLRLLAGQRSYMGFLLAVTLFGFAMSTYFTFLSVHMLNLGGSTIHLGLMWLAMAAIEVPIMFFGARSIERYGYRRILNLSFCGFVIGWIAMAFVPSPLTLILTVVWIGTCFSCYWVSVVNYADQSAPPGLNATTQALLGAAQGGLGWSLGAIFAGYLWDVAGATTLFLAAAGIVALAALSFSWSNRAVQPVQAVLETA
ncbi:MAG: MFS transporter [Caldilineaceae bacterium]|nr:MFS transporter [Caldilineaceae bacterium]